MGSVRKRGLRLGFLGLGLAVMVALGTNAYAKGRFVDCFEECGPTGGECHVWAFNCTSCDSGISGDGCWVTGSGCSDIGCKCNSGSGWSCNSY